MANTGLSQLLMRTVSGAVHGSRVIETGQKTSSLGASMTSSKSGNVAASSSLDSHVRVWDVDTGKCIKSMEAGPVDAWTISFSPDSRFLATGSHSGKINLFGVESGRKEESLDIRGGFTLSIAYSPDGKLIASGAIDGIINIFDTQTGRLIHTLEGRH
uniref:WD repeat-containing protein 61 n=1 Tax=Magallana gigas TaxID=29159 RepID=K1QRY7_MAGGI